MSFKIGHENQKSGIDGEAAGKYQCLVRLFWSVKLSARRDQDLTSPALLKMV